MVKFPREKKVIAIKEEDPLVASINTIVFDLNAVMNSKKEKEIPPIPGIRKVWIPKKYLTYKNDLAIERGVSAVKEKKK